MTSEASDSDLRAARAMIDTLRSEFVRAFAVGDVDRLLALYDDEYVDMSVGVATRGRADMGDAFVETFSVYDGRLTIRTEEVLVNGDWAIERGTFTIHLTERASGAESESRRRYLEVLVRRDGGWRIFRDLDNELPPEEGGEDAVAGTGPPAGRG
jgi:uncharacterized protein (TIGR02246 family)